MGRTPSQSPHYMVPNVHLALSVFDHCHVLQVEASLADSEKELLEGLASTEDVLSSSYLVAHGFVSLPVGRLTLFGAVECGADDLSAYSNVSAAIAASASELVAGGTDLVCVGVDRNGCVSESLWMAKETGSDEKVLMN